MIQILVIRTTEEPFLTTVDPTLENLQAFVGGYLEAIGSFDWVMYLDEDGKSKGKEPNPTASVLAHRLGWQGMRAGDFIVGDVIVCGRRGERETDVPEHVQHVLEGMH